MSDTQPQRAVALLSGGVDSTVLVAQALALGYDVLPLAVRYGQRHARELESAYQVARYYGRDLRLVNLDNLRAILSGSALTDDAISVPHGHYEAPSMAQTVVPNRNAILLMIAAGYAAAQGAQFVATAVHAGDHAIYPDCRPDFINVASRAAQFGTQGVGPAGGNVSILAPFVSDTKAAIVSIGATLNAPFHLTYSCYEGGDVHCGRCGTCTERREAFALAGVVDPTAYLHTEAPV